MHATSIIALLPMFVVDAVLGAPVPRHNVQETNRDNIEVKGASVLSESLKTKHSPKYAANESEDDPLAMMYFRKYNEDREAAAEQANSLDVSAIQRLPAMKSGKNSRYSDGYEADADADPLAMMWSKVDDAPEGFENE